MDAISPELKLVCFCAAENIAFTTSGLGSQHVQEHDFRKDVGGLILSVPGKWLATAF